MWVEINGFDYTDFVPYDSITSSSSISDPLPQLDFDLLDTGCQIALAIGMEIVLHDENHPPEAGNVPTIPARNLLQKAVFFPDTTAWTTIGSLASRISRATPDNGSITMTFSNNALGSGFIQQTTLPGYIKPGQTYMLSVYETISTPLSHAQAICKFDFLDQNLTTLPGGVSDTRSSTLSNGQQRIAIQAIAPANAVYIRIQLGGQSTTGGNNSGSVIFGTPQLEPMLFLDRGVVYPTPDCNFNQTNCSRLPDDTISRTTRIYAGYIESLAITYDGPNRKYHVACAPAAKVIENTNLISATYVNTFDDTIIQGILAANYAGLLSGGGTSQASPPTSIIRGIEVVAASYTDMTLREILNSLTDQSGYTYQVDPYYQLRYQPAFYDVANFMLSDTPDGISSFAYSDYTLSYDGSQMKQRVKVIGANPTGPEIEDLFPGGGAGPFGLSHIPASINSVTTGGGANTVLAGIAGVNTFAQGYGALVDPANQILQFQNPTPSGDVSIKYTYQNPVVVTVEKLDTVISSINAPNYITPTFDAKVNDSNLLSLATANTRGLAEITKFANPVISITCTCQQYALPGTMLYFTNTRDSIVKQPFVIQQVSSKALGGGMNEYTYTLGGYLPTIIDHIRNTNKTVNRSTQIGNVTTSLQADIVTTETITYSEQVNLR